MPLLVGGVIIMALISYSEDRLKDPNTINLLYKQLGDLFKTKCVGCNVFVFSGNLEAVKSIGLRSKCRIILKNGKIDSRLLHYPIKDGSYK